MKPLTLAALVLVSLAGSAQAARKQVQVPNRFDGTWSIEVITESGTCDRAYRYGVRIENGEARYPGNDFRISGRIAGNGVVRATISSAAGSASVVGRLGSEGFGNGTWNTVGGSTRCSGRWNAERRG